MLLYDVKWHCSTEAEEMDHCRCRRMVAVRYSSGTVPYYTWAIRTLPTCSIDAYLVQSVRTFAIFLLAAGTSRLWPRPFRRTPRFCLFRYSTYLPSKWVGRQVAGRCGKHQGRETQPFGLILGIQVQIQSVLQYLVPTKVAGKSNSKSYVLKELSHKVVN